MSIEHSALAALDPGPVAGAAPADVIEVDARDMEQLIRAAVAENYGGYERKRAGVDWIWSDGRGAHLSLADLPPVREIQFAFLDMLEMVCDTAIQIGKENNAAAQLGWMLQRSRVRADGFVHFRCLIVLIPPEGGGAPIPKAQGESVQPAEAIALAMLDLADVDMAALHRELFPHRYIVT